MAQYYSLYSWLLSTIVHSPFFVAEMKATEKKTREMTKWRRKRKERKILGKKIVRMEKRGMK